MLLDQKLEHEDGKFRLTNTIDIGQAKSLVADRNKSGGERSKNLVCMGHIPREMFSFDPWLLQATKAQMAGDKYEYQKYIKKFFEVHPQFAIQNSRKYYSGGVGQ